MAGESVRPALLFARCGFPHDAVLWCTKSQFPISHLRYEKNRSVGQVPVAESLHQGVSHSTMNTGTGKRCLLGNQGSVMLHNWPFWLGGTTLAAICVAHWLSIGRMLGVSGRYSAIVNRIRFGAVPDDNIDDAKLAQELEAATLAAFGKDALAEVLESHENTPAAQSVASEQRPPQSLSAHLVFLASLILGGFLAAVLDGRFSVDFSLRDDATARLLGNSRAAQALLLFGGGILVGIGTRMAGGCTSGHGLCGTSRLQPGSIVATAAFFLSGATLTRLLFGG